MVYVARLVLMVFFYFLHLIATCLCMVHKYAILVAMSYHCWFFVFLSSLSLVFPFMF